MYRLILILALIIVHISCNNEESLIEENIRFNKDCLSQINDFPNRISSEDIKMTGSIDQQSFSIIDSFDTFESILLYQSKFTTSSDTLTPGSSEASRCLLIGFKSKILNIFIGLRVPINGTDYNSEIKSLFENTSEIPLSTNLGYTPIELILDFGCENKTSTVSSLYSSVLSQILIVDEFKFSSNDDLMNYSLKVHVENLNVASRQYNDFDPDIVKEIRGDFNPIYNLKIDTFNILFSIPI